MKVTTEAGAVFPNALDSFNIDAMLKRLSEILGVSIDVLNSTETVQLIRQGRADAQAQQMQLEQADIIADQFIGGAYALFAIEGMALGKPVMCYLREELFPCHPEWAECPIVNTNPGNLQY